METTMLDMPVSPSRLMKVTPEALAVGDDAGHPDPGAVVGLMEVGGGQCVDLLGGDPDPPDQVSHRRIQAIGVAFSDNLLGVLSPIDRTSVRPRRTA
jgi:hypothetical protein